MKQEVQQKAEYSQPELKSLGTYHELTQVERTGPRFDGGPPGLAGQGAPGQLS